MPKRLRYRLARILYNYESHSTHGIELVVPLLGDGLACSINTKDIIGWCIFFFGEYEKGTNHVLAEYVKKGHVVLELGANLGSETLIVSRLVGSEGHVYGFEPNPYTFKRLQRNIEINGISNVDIYELAIGENNTEIYFNIYPENSSNPGMSSKYVENPCTKKINVKQVTIDSFMQQHNITKLDFLKLDIQGAEIDALNGARNTIAKYRPIIFAEAYSEEQVAHNHTQQMYDMLMAYGYKIFLIEDNNLISLASGPVDGNWLAKQDRPRNT